MGDPSPQPATSDTAVRILDVAQGLAQSRGFNGFSYADIAARLSITKASLHYHFASKAELGAALIARYTQRFGSALSRLEAHEPQNTLHRYVELYESVLVRDEMCLCGMFAAEYSTLPSQMQTEVRVFFDANDAWLAQLLERGRTSGDLRFEGAAIEAARMLTAGLEGAMLVSRSYCEPERFSRIATRLLAAIGVERAAKHRRARSTRRVRRSAAR